MVTGASTGLGLHTAQALSAAGHEVVGHVRDRSRVPEPAAQAWVGVVHADLTDLGQLRDLARRADEHGPFDAVIHNAGVLHPPDALLVNTVAPYVLTALMARPARLIYLSSGMHRSGSADLRGLDRGNASYSDSKLWVTALSMAFAARWHGTVSHAVDPGWVPTRMGGRHAPDDLTAGHETQVWLATADDLAPATGGYWHHRTPQRPHPAALDRRFQDQLLDALAARTGVTVD